jgi:hypothetical protein
MPAIAEKSADRRFFLVGVPLIFVIAGAVDETGALS